jgi:hypothetical protein
MRIIEKRRLVCFQETGGWGPDRDDRFGFEKPRSELEVTRSTASDAAKFVYIRIQGGDIRAVRIIVVVASAAATAGCSTSLFILYVI